VVPGVSCSASRDEHGTTYHIPEAKAVRGPGGRPFRGTASVDVWWDRQFKRNKQNETLLIRQESTKERADVVELTLGQVYDLIHALGWAVMRP
jgi:hypothetical protein